MNAGGPRERLIARKQHRSQHRGVIVLDEQRERFLRRRRHHGHNSL
ncbi:hypothetical protein SIM91_44050 [Rhodococcus opacus]|nr:hypothetical protein [Rhodococcus opacus]MDX5970119.1 hypothetical protein [Rhodococcus opacus]NKY75209.1 hypothetical protein [Rhodococcus opacus]